MSTAPIIDPRIMAASAAPAPQMISPPVLPSQTQGAPEQLIDENTPAFAKDAERPSGGSLMQSPSTNPWMSIISHTQNIHNPVARTAARIGSLMMAGLADTGAGVKMQEIQASQNESNAKLMQSQQEHQQEMQHQQEEHDQSLQQQDEIHRQTLAMQQALAGQNQSAEASRETQRETAASALENQRFGHEQILEKQKEAAKTQDPLTQELKQQHIDQNNQKEQSDTDNLYYGLYDQDNYHNAYKDWQKSGNFAKDSGLMSQQLTASEGGGGGRGDFAGILARTPATMVAAMGVDGVMHAAGDVLNGYKDTLIKAGISTPGQKVLQDYTQAVLARLQFDMNTMGAKASTMRMRELLRLAMQNVPPPNLENQDFEGRFKDYYGNMEARTKRHVAPAGYKPPPNPYQDQTQNDKGGYTIGQVYPGRTGSYKYKGGDPKQVTSWEKQ